MNGRRSLPPVIQSARDLSNDCSFDGYDDLVAIHDVAARFYRERLHGSWVPGYLAGRGFGIHVQQQWQVGYAPAERDALTARLRAAGYTDSLILAAGLARRTSRGGLTDTFRDRVVLPIRSPNGTIVAFIGRTADNAGSDRPKYLNSPSTPLYGKGGVLFGLSEARNALAGGAMPVIVEGPFDVMAVAAARDDGYAPVAPCGTALTARQVAALGSVCQLACTEVLVAFDGDRAGRRAAVGAYQLLGLHCRRVLAVVLPGGQDPAQVLRDQDADGLVSLLGEGRVPLADLVVDAEIRRWEHWLEFAEGQIGALRAIAPVIAAMPAADVGRQAGRLADRLSLDYATVTEAVIDALEELVSGGGASSRSQRHEAPERVEASCAGQLEFPVGALHDAARTEARAFGSDDLVCRRQRGSEPRLRAGRVAS